MSKKWFFVVSALIFLGQTCLADQFYRKDYSDQWVIYDEDSQSFRPWLATDPSYQVIHFFIDANHESGRKLELCHTGEISLFIDGNIVNQYVKEKCIRLNTDSLFRHFKKDTIQFTVYKNESWATISTSILFPALGYVPDAEVTSNRELSSDTNFIIVALLILGFGVIFARESFPKFFQEFSNAVRTFSLRVRASQLYAMKFYSPEVITVMLLQAGIISFFLLSIGKLYPGVAGFLGISGIGFWGQIGFWILYTVVIYIVLCIQYVMLSLVNSAFNSSKLLHIQFYDSLRINQFGFVLLFILLGTSYMLHQGLFVWVLSIIWYLLIFLFMARSLLIYIKMINQTSHRKVHILSYFCATEILPVVLVVKVFFI